MSKRISEFPLAQAFLNSDFLATVQDGVNYKVTGNIIKANLAEDFASNAQLSEFTEDFAELVSTVDNNYADLSDRIITGDNTVSHVLNNTIVSYYDTLNNKIVTVESGHNADISQLSNTIQSWINEINDKVDENALTNLLNRLTISENLLTQLSEIVYSYNGNPGSGTGGGTPGYHTQSTATIFPLSGYYLTGSVGNLSTTDSLNQALAKLEGRINVVETTGGGSGGGGGYYLITSTDRTAATDGNVYSAKRSDMNYLSKVNDDIAAGKITFLQGWQAGPIFTEGFLGTGAALFKNGNRWKMEVDDLFVRGGLTVNELIVNEIKAVGGEILVTVADMEVVNVETLTNEEIYRCYFDDQDGTILNKFEIYDQAICQKFDGKNVKRYWRLVTGVGSNYIELSMTDFEPGSGLPEVGDKILQLGNRNNAERRSAIMISAKGSDGPSIKMYDNIYEYSLENKERTVLGKNSKFVGAIQVTDQTGDAYPVVIDKGAYVPGQTYYYYDRVSYNGSLWLCMALNTTAAPSIDQPDIWLQQVAQGEKGQSGQAGDDVGKWVRIVGGGLFFYEEYKDNTFVGVPNPSSITLSCEVQGIDNPTYAWTLGTDNTTVISTTSTCTISHTQVLENLVGVTCTVTDTDTGSTYYDNEHIGKVANGADARLMYVTNTTMTIPYNSDGVTPLTNLSNIYSDIFVYKGTTLQTISKVNATLISGQATVSVVKQSNIQYRIIPTEVRSTMAAFMVQATVPNSAGGSSIFERILWINQTLSGAPGAAGKDAGAVQVTGPNMFITDQQGTISPSQITLTASVSGIETYTVKWYWSPVDTYNWTEIVGQTANTLNVGPTMYGFNGGTRNELLFKVSVTNGVHTWEDWMTVVKLRNGIDGKGSYLALLTNENHSVVADYRGVVPSTEFTKASTNYVLMFGTDEVPTTDYTVLVTNVDASDPSTVNLNTALKKITLNNYTADSPASTIDSHVFRIEFKIGGSIVATKDFTVSKSKAGAPGNYEVIIYAIRSTQPYVPTFRNIPTSGGSVGGDGTWWYTDIRPGRPVWMCKATFDGRTGQAILVRNQYWTTPVKITGDDGATGPTGATGPRGNDGAAGLQGPGLNYRGLYQTNTNYYLSQYMTDVVKNGQSGIYYCRINTAYNATTAAPTNTTYWKQLNSFQNIATGLLFAESASIAGFEFHNQWIRSQSNNFFLDGRPNNAGTANPASPRGGDFPILIGPNVYTVGGGSLGLGSITPNNATFSIDKDGKLMARNAEIHGSFITGDARGNEGNRIILDGINKNISLMNSNDASVFILDFDTNTAVSRMSQMRILEVTGSSSQNIEAELRITPSKISLMNYTGVGIFEVDTGGSSLRVYMKLPTTNIWGVGSLWRDSQGYVRIG